MNDDHCPVCASEVAAYRNVLPERACGLPAVRCGDPWHDASVDDLAARLDEMADMADTDGWATCWGDYMRGAAARLRELEAENVALRSELHDVSEDRDTLRIAGDTLAADAEEVVWNDEYNAPDHEALDASLNRWKQIR